MRIIIAGAFAIGSYLAKLLSRNKQEVVLMDQDEEKLGKVLNDAKFEDPTILVEYSKELKQTIIQGQGEHHLNILRSPCTPRPPASVV